MSQWESPPISTAVVTEPPPWVRTIAFLERVIRENAAAAERRRANRKGASITGMLLAFLAVGIYFLANPS